jgi:hypothetical protein
MENKLTKEELVSRIKKHSRVTVIPKNKIILSKKEKQKRDRRSWRKDLHSKQAIPLIYIY